MIRFEVKIDRRALDDVRDAIAYYDAVSAQVGDKFIEEFDNTVETLKLNPFFQVRYSNVRCLPLRKFPFLIHFTINE